MRISDSRKLLEKLGIEYLFREDPEEKPEFFNLKFSDLIPEFAFGTSPRVKKISKCYLFSHQYQCYALLSAGKNVILVSGTGSGKTEAWAIYALSHRIKTIAVYPNLALVADQLLRLKEYCQCIGADAIEINATTAQILHKIPDKVLIVTTNPAYLLTEIKSGGRILQNFLHQVELIVLDELDYYGSSRAALLLKMIELLCKYINHKKPRIVILTATLENAEELQKILKKINNRDTEVIRGKAWKVKNRTFILLGPKKAVSQFKNNVLRILNNPEFKDLSEEIKYYPDSLYSIILNLQERLPPEKFYELLPDDLFDTKIEYLLAEYIKEMEDGVTIVFTRTIEEAEKLAKRVKQRCKVLGITNVDDLVATHHHLVDKETREYIEKKAREGVIKLIFSPRTLEQGIDIGTVVRVVHIGIPWDVRQFLQREGRKGRREYIPFTETIICPISDIDRYIVRQGFRSLDAWLSLGLEKLIIIPDNDLLRLSEAMFKLFRLGGEELSIEEYDLLKRLNIIKSIPKLSPTKFGRNAWRWFQFYEFGQPMQIPREMKKHDKLIILSPISRKDLVSKFQLGYIDPQSDGVVISIFTSAIPSVLEIHIKNLQNYASKNNIKWMLYALSKYKALKSIWKEQANFIKDYIEGYIETKPLVNAQVPEGFGIITIFPLGVEWIIESRKRQPFKIGDEIIFLKAIKSINVSIFKTPFIPAKDFTYGYSIQLENADMDTVEAALALFLAYLRKYHKISLRDLKFCILQYKGYILVKIWESEAIKLINSLDFNSIINDIMNIKIDEDLITLAYMIDKEAGFYLKLYPDNAKDMLIQILKMFDARIKILDMLNNMGMKKIAS